jgi:hypothetical protein
VALRSLLAQTYPSYNVMFIVESDLDPASRVVDGLCAEYPHARKVVSGISGRCAQKNHNLVEGSKHLLPETELLVFCDSTNVADPHWLERFTYRLRAGRNEVITTFRAFDPQPRSIGGMCQAMYAALLLLFAINRPTPWGGGTAIGRANFEKLGVRQAWAATVVDDLVLGNLVQRAGIKVFMEPAALLRSPVRGQTLRGFVGYLDRQIMFPKFTNPGMWAQACGLYLNLTVASLVSVLIGCAFPFGWFDGFTAVCAYGFLASFATFVYLLRGVSPVHIPLSWWLAAFPPCFFLAAMVFFRSLYRNHIDWHGKRYWPGSEGVVLCVEATESAPGPEGRSD